MSTNTSIAKAHHQHRSINPPSFLFTNPLNRFQTEDPGFATPHGSSSPPAPRLDPSLESSSLSSLPALAEDPPFSQFLNQPLGPKIPLSPPPRPPPRPRPSSRLFVCVFPLPGLLSSLTIPCSRDEHPNHQKPAGRGKSGSALSTCAEQKFEVKVT